MSSHYPIIFMTEAHVQRYEPFSGVQIDRRKIEWRSTARALTELTVMMTWWMNSDSDHLWPSPPLKLDRSDEMMRDIIDTVHMAPNLNNPLIHFCQKNNNKKRISFIFKFGNFSNLGILNNGCWMSCRTRVISCRSAISTTVKDKQLSIG